MKQSDGNPIRPESISSADFVKLADEAMRRAYLVAKKDAARYGLKLVVNRPCRSPRKAGAARSRRVVESV